MGRAPFCQNLGKPLASAPGQSHRVSHGVSRFDGQSTWAFRLWIPAVAGDFFLRSPTGFAVALILRVSPEEIVLFDVMNHDQVRRL
jgi:hypothetical protein